MPRTLLLTAFALLAFAGNSILCRLALERGLVDPATFTVLRTLAGALVLLPLLRGAGLSGTDVRERIGAAAALAVYLLGFSLAYRTLTAGTGALILFGAVQATMLGVAVRRGEPLGLLGWSGSATALLGLVVLMLPGLAAPDLLGAVLMTVAGIAWGAYSVIGAGGRDPARTTAVNFLLAVPIVLAAGGAALLGPTELFLTVRGAGLAVAAGAITSALGYVIWYAALERVKSSTAASLQLLVPLLATAGGAALLAETVTARLATAALLTLSGIALVLRARRPADADAG